MQAVILVGGRGERLAPYTSIIPKPLMPIGELPLLEIIIRQLHGAGFRRVTLALGHFRDYFKSFLAQRHSLQALLAIDYVEETTPLGTAGALATIPDLADLFLVMNGDILTTLDYQGFFQFHQQLRPTVSIAMHRLAVPIPCGLLEVSEQGRVTGYTEKPILQLPTSMGIYVCARSVLRHVRGNESLDFPTLVQRSLQAGEEIRVYPNSATWLDVGRHETLVEANRLFLTRMADFLPPIAA